MYIKNYLLIGQVVSILLSCATVHAEDPQQPLSQEPDFIQRNRLRKPVIFTTASWKKAMLRSDKTVQRSSLFAAFLRQYDLIGMPRQQVLTLLGTPDGSTLYTLAADNIDVYTGVEIEFDHERVNRWRIRGRFTSLNPWITTDMLWDPNGRLSANGKATLFIPKPKAK